MEISNCNYNNIMRHKYKPTKTDIKGITRWLRRSSSDQIHTCPFDNGGFQQLPHWKCWNIFGNKLLSVFKYFSSFDDNICDVVGYIECPCTKLKKVENVTRTARRIVKRWNQKNSH